MPALRKLRQNCSLGWPGVRSCFKTNKPKHIWIWITEECLNTTNDLPGPEERRGEKPNFSAWSSMAPKLPLPLWSLQFFRKESLRDIQGQCLYFPTPLLYVYCIILSVQNPLPSIAFCGENILWPRFNSNDTYSFPPPRGSMMANMRKFLLECYIWASAGVGIDYTCGLLSTFLLHWDLSRNVSIFVFSRT